jgi:hypothetical protein
LSLHKSSILSHLISEKHITKKASKEGAQEQQQQILTSIELFKKESDAVGLTNISDREKLFRYDVVFSFLLSGNPLESMNSHRPLLEK